MDERLIDADLPTSLDRDPYASNLCEAQTKAFWKDATSDLAVVTCSSLYDFFLTEYASVAIFLRQILLVAWWETLLILLSATSSPLFFTWFRFADGQPMHYSSMNWTLLSILLVFPMSLSMGAAYSRRDKAIGSLQSFKSNVLCTFLAHLDWDWPFIPKDPAEPVVSGRGQRLSPDHVDRVFNTLKELTHLLRVLLLAPRVSQVRHFCTRLGKKQRARVLSVSAGLQRRLMLELHSLSLHVEQLKAAGLPANEAARIRQYFLNLVESVRSLLSVKRYHTPLGMRAFSRLFILLLPWLFGPYFGALATAVGIAFSISFSCTTSLALLGLFTIRYELEDPFLVVGHYGCRDSIDVGGELDDLEAEMMLYTTPRQVRHTMDQSGAS